MKLKVTKVLAKELNKHLENMHVEQCLFTEHQYKMWCSINEFDALDYGDVDFNDNGDYVFKCWRIVYPPEYYAWNNYVGTKDLQRLAKKINKCGYGVTIENLAVEFMNEYAI